MEHLKTYLFNLIDDVFKILPMKEAEIDGDVVFVAEYVDALIINMKGAMITYPELSLEKDYLYIINNLEFLLNNEADFKRWRKIILNSCTNIKNLFLFFGGIKHDKL